MYSTQSVDFEVQKVDDFLAKWNRCNELINNSEVAPSTVELVTTLTKELVELLILEHPIYVGADVPSHHVESAKPGPLLSITVRERVLEKLLLWVEGPPSQGNELLMRVRDQQRAHLLGLFETLMTQSRQNVMTEISVLRPLLQFLFKLSSQLRPVYSRVYGRTLYEFCVLLCRDSRFLDHCRKICDELFDQPHIVFSLLVPLIHQSDAIGDWARDAFLLVLSVSKRDDALGNYLAFESDFCPILATGLSGLYSSLPKKLVPRHELPSSSDADSPGGPVTLTSAAFLEPLSSTPCIVELPVGGPSWHQLAENEWNQSTDLRRFLHTLDFCNLVIKICHQNVREQLLYFINSGFLVPVLGSALHQSSLDEVVAATAYLELFLRRLTEPALIKLVLNFIVNGTHDSYSILSSLTNRLNSKAAMVTDVVYQLGMVTLSLFRTILSFHCEDVMYELIFKYLVPLYDTQPIITSGDSASHSPRTQHLSRWRGSQKIEDNSSSSHAIASRHLALDLVRSGDRFLALATTAAPDKRFDLSTSEQFMRYINLVENGNSAGVSSSRHSSVNRRHFSSTNLMDSMERSSHSENADLTNDWVLVRTKFAEFTPPESPCLFPYLRCTVTRIQRRRDACAAWRSLYAPRNSDFSDTLTVSHTDKELEENEKRDRNDIHLSPKHRFPIQTGSSISNEMSMTGQPNNNEDSRSNGDLDSPLPAPLTVMSRAQATSLYQLNYFEDSSEEEALSTRQREASEMSAHSREFHQASSITPDSPAMSPNTNAYLPIKPKVTTENCTCTCLTTTEASVVMEACSQPDLDHVPLESSSDEQQLARFVKNLDMIASPWDCRLHFGHLPPVEPIYPEIDSEFLTGLSMKLQQSGLLLSDSPTRVEALETSSIHMETDSLRDLDISGIHDVTASNNSASTMYTVSLEVPRPSITCSIAVKKPSTNAAPTAGGIGPFLWILLSRLSNMHTNCLFTNLLLTDLLAALASYPCPLLFDFLLNGTSLMPRSNVNSVYKCLHSVRNQLLSSAAAIENWHSLVYRARLYLNCEKQFLADMLIDPEFYGTRKLSRPTGRTSAPETSTRSVSVDRSAERNRMPRVQPIWLPSDMGPDLHRLGRTQPTSSPSSTEEPGSASQLVLTSTSKPSAFPNSLTPLLPVDYPRRRQPHPGNSASKTHARAASFSHAPPMVVRVGQHHLPSVSISKPIWTRASRYAMSPVLRKANLFSSSGSRHPTRPDSSESEDEEMQAVYQPEIPTSTRNLVFAAVIFDEFCHELAALCYNHSLDRSLFT